MFPYCKNSEERNSQQFKDKMAKGPVGLLQCFPIRPILAWAQVLQCGLYIV